MSNQPPYQPPFPVQAQVPQPPSRPWYKKKRFVIPLGLVAFFVIIGAFSSDPETKTASPDATATSSAAETRSTEEIDASATLAALEEELQQKQDELAELEAEDPPAEEPQPDGIPGDGTYEVGVDIKPGRYSTSGADISCYWARLRNTDGGLSSIIANGNTTGRTTVTIKKTDGAFETTGCNPWERRK